MCSLFSLLLCVSLSSLLRPLSSSCSLLLLLLLLVLFAIAFAIAVQRLVVVAVVVIVTTARLLLHFIRCFCFFVFSCDLSFTSICSHKCAHEYADTYGHICDRKQTADKFSVNMREKNELKRRKEAGTSETDCGLERQGAREQKEK